MVRFAVVGFGMIGAVHAQTIKKNKNAKLVAIVENDPKKLDSVVKGNIDTGQDDNVLAGVQTFGSIDEMLAQTDVDCVSVCLPTYIHREFAVKALQAGKRVVCEKPMALSIEDCDAMIKAAKETNKKLFIAQCIRFWPEYTILKKYIDSKELGNPTSIVLRRISGSPFWAGPQSWFANPQKSGGCLFDLHVHDLDFIQYLFGRPKAVYAQGITGKSGGNESVIAQYHFKDNLICMAEGSWAYPAGFKMSYTALFEKGKLEFDSSASPTLTLQHMGKEETQPIPVPQGDGYQNEYEYFINCIINDQTPVEILPESARQSIEIALAEKQSIEQNDLIQF